MEPATDVAKQAAQEIISQGGPYAALFILIGAVALIFFGFVYWSQRSDLKAKDALIAELQKGWRDDTKSNLLSVTAALDTVKNAIGVLSSGRK